MLILLGWDVWSPKEVNTEFTAVPTEDRTKVDIALFATNHSPSVFIEVKAVGKISQNLAAVERQVRDYNRNNNALFSVITDGRMWRFYYSLTSGEFHQKCFEECDLLEHDLEKIKQTFSLFLEKEIIRSGRAEEEARKYLLRSNIQKAVQNCLPQAKRLVQSSPFPSLPQAISKLVEQNTGTSLSECEAAELLKRMPEHPTPVVLIPHESPPRVAQVAPTQRINSENSNRTTVSLNPDNLGDLRFTKVEGTIGEKYGNKWNDLVRLGVRLAVESGHEIRALNSHLRASIKAGTDTRDGYIPIDNLDITVQGIDATGAAETLVQLAKLLACPLKLTVTWQSRSPHAGDQSIIRLE